MTLSYEEERQIKSRAAAIRVTVSIGIMVAIVASMFWIFPQWNVWASGLSGRATLAEAEFSRQARTMEAQAKLDASYLEAKAEVVKSKGTAEANRILAEGLGGPSGYLRWKYINMLEETGNGNSIIYIPTEAAMPILEAGKR